MSLADHQHSLLYHLCTPLWLCAFFSPLQSVQLWQLNSSVSRSKLFQCLKLHLGSDDSHLLDAIGAIHAVSASLATIASIAILTLGAVVAICAVRAGCTVLTARAVFTSGAIYLCGKY